MDETNGMHGASSLWGKPGPKRRPPRLGVRALAHPATVAAVALLLLNDHLLKTSFPGSWTGKLSDVAGLFFFPMLVAFGLGGLAPGRPARAVGFTAFTSSALAFAFLKAHPGVNSAVREAAQALLGMRLQLALDPSDLWALLIMPPAFLLWIRLECVGTAPAESRRGWVMVAVASLAAIATSPCPPADPIGRLFDTPIGILAIGRSEIGWTQVYRSRNAGQDWEYAYGGQVPSELPISLDESQPAFLACVPPDRRICYRIDGSTPLVEATRDGGQTWSGVWAPRAERLSYMRRVAAGSGRPMACGKHLDLTPHDMILLGEGEDHWVLIALGNEGVLRGRIGGPWEQFAVGYLRPSPDHARSLEEMWPPTIIGMETLTLILGGGLGFLVLSWIARSRLAWRPGASRRGFGWTWGLVAGSALLAIAALVLLAEPSLLIAYVVVPFAGVLAFLAHEGQQWAIALRDAEERIAARRALGLSILGSWGSAVLAWIPLALWVVGAIPWYEVALAVALVLFLLPAIAAGLALARPRGGRRAPQA